MSADAQRDDIPNLVQRLEQGDRAALSRLLTFAAADYECEAVAAAIGNRSRESPSVIALTGSAGVGKSSLLGALTAHLAAQGERIGVLACDPESPVTGGALLGDRCRIVPAAVNDRVFVRSLSTVSGQQGIAPHIELMVELMRAFGFDRVFIETVGAGQGDVAVRRVADVVVLAVQPQSGDELQWEKAGILELADVVVVNKSDLPGADRVVADVTQQLNTSGVPVVKTSVARGEGIEELCGAIEEVSLRNREGTGSVNCRRTGLQPVPEQPRADGSQTRPTHRGGMERLSDESARKSDQP